MPTDNNTPTTPPLDVFGLMVDEITKRVTANATVLLDQKRIESMVSEAVAKTKRTLITIEDKRRVPSVTTEVNEPVHKVLPDVIGILKSGCWCAAVGPTGSGKTLGGIQYIKLSGIKMFSVKQMSNMMAPHDLIGFIDAEGHYRKGAWTECIIGREYNNDGIAPIGDPTNVPAMIIIDEMDNANANIIMLVKALAVGHIMMPYGLQKVNPSLGVMATMNTWGTGANREYVGRMAQDAALLNEFSFVEWGYDTDFERELLEQTFASFTSTGDYELKHMHCLHSMFISMRAKAEAQKIRCIISTRDIIKTAKILLNNTSWPIHKVLCQTVYKGMKDEEIKRIEAPEHWTPVAVKTGKPAQPTGHIIPPSPTCPI